MEPTPSFMLWLSTIMAFSFLYDKILLLNYSNLSSHAAMDIGRWIT